MYPMGGQAPPPQGGGFPQQQGYPQQGYQQQQQPGLQGGYGQGAGWQQQPGMQQPGGSQQQYRLTMNQPAPPPSQHYGSYGQQFQQNVFSINAWQAVGFNSQDELQYLFQSKVSQRYNAIQAQELMEILNQSPQMRNYYGINWSMEMCKIMIAMLDRSRDGMMQWPEFTELLKCLTYWFQTFKQYDHDNSGYMEAQELGKCISQRFGYQLSPAAMTQIMKRYCRAMDDGRLLLAFDDFVSMSIRLRSYTEAFRARDRTEHGGHETGKYTFGYDDFLQCVMCL